MSKRILSIIILSCILGSKVVTANTGGNMSIEGTISVRDDANTNVDHISVTVPTSINFWINPSDINAVIHTPIKFENNSTVAVEVDIADFYIMHGSSDYNLITKPEEFSWNNLGYDTNIYSLGLMLDGSSDWLDKDRTTYVNEDIYSKNVDNVDGAVWATNGSSGQKRVAGVLPRKENDMPSEGLFSLVTRHGTLFTEEGKKMRLGDFVLKWNISIY